MVTVVIGILALLSVPSIFGAVNRTEATVTANDLKSSVGSRILHHCEWRLPKHHELHRHSRVDRGLSAHCLGQWKLQMALYRSSYYTYILIYNRTLPLSKLAGRPDDRRRITNGNLRVALGGGLFYLLRLEDAS